MRPTYADLMLISAAPRPRQAAPTPLLGLLSGLVFAAVLWTGIAWTIWALLR